MNTQRIVGNAKTKYDMASEMDYMLRKMGRFGYWCISYTAFSKSELKDRYLSILDNYNIFINK